MNIKKGDMIKIYDKEYWTTDSLGTNTRVNGIYFSSSLDDIIEYSEMATYFGKACQIENINNDIFNITGDRMSSYNWDICCIERILNREDDPEYFL